MEKRKVISLAQYKAERLGARVKGNPGHAEPVLPGVDRLWELLDRNISLSVWDKRD